MSIFYYIDEADRSTDVTEGTLQITNQGQARSDTCQFEVFNGSRPIENQDVRIYDGDVVSDIEGNVITLTGNFEPNCNKFYPGQELWLRPLTATAEKVIVQSYDETNLLLTLESSPIYTTSQGDQIGEIIFGGIISNMGDQNLQILQNIVYNIKCVDYTKLFDKRLISSAWSNVDGRYIINDFCNTTVNYNQTLDYLSYADDPSLQAVWGPVTKTLTKSWSETHQNSSITFYTNAAWSEGGQPFVANGGTLDSVKFYLKKFGTPTGNAVAKIYAAVEEVPGDGVYIPTGAALATSDNFNIASLTTSFQLITFNFSGGNRINLVGGQRYVVVYAPATSTYPNWTELGIDGSATGQWASFKNTIGGAWGAMNHTSVIYYVNVIANDAGSPTVDSVDYIELSSSAIFPWSYASGGAVWEGALTAKDISDIVGVSSGVPTKGKLMLWAKFSSLTGLGPLIVRVGSSSSNYAEFTYTPTVEADWEYFSKNFSSASIVGTPNWTNTVYGAIIVSGTASGTVKINGLRVNDNSSFSLFNVQSTTPITDYRSQQKKSTTVINELAQAFTYAWYVDYDKDIHFTTPGTKPAPFEITDTSNNFFDLRYAADTTNIGNQVIVNGGEQTSTSVYSQVFPADGVLRAWLLKNLFANLVMKVDDNTTTKTATTGTTATTLKITGHGLSLGDWIVNRTRSNAVRQVQSVVDANTITVQSVTSQASGDTISYFSKTPTLGQEGVVDESTVDYVYNADQKSVRSSAQTTTLPSGVFIEFAYNERTPIEFQYRDTASINRLKALGEPHGDGVYDLAPITDTTITDLFTAILVAKAKVNQFSNPVITGTFMTRSRGFKVGQLLTINITIGRTLNDTFLIQKVQKKQKGGKYQDYMEFTVTFATTLFGWIELMQKILHNGASLGSGNTTEIVETFVASDETIATVDTNAVGLDGINKVTNTEVPVASDSNNSVTFTPPWHWESSNGFLLHKFDESHFDATSTLAGGGQVGVAQSFAGAEMLIDSAKFYIRKLSSPTGNIVAKLYAMTGSMGTTSKPTGAALATSDPIDITTLTTSLAVVTFTFSGSNRYHMQSGVNYCITLEYSGSGGSLVFGFNQNTPTDPGNLASLTGSTWTAFSGQDLIFYVLGGQPLPTRWNLFEWA